MRTLLLLGLSVLVLAGAAWLLLREGGRAPAWAPVAETSPAEAATPGDSPAAALALPPTAPGQASERAHAPGLEAGPGDPAASIPPSPERASGGVRGRLVDAVGRGVADAPVRLARGGLLRWRDARSAEESSARTDESGSFLLETSVEGSWQLAVDAPGFAPLRRSVTLVPGHVEDLGALALEPGVHLSGRVEDATGRGVAGAELLRPVLEPAGVRVFGASPGERLATTDESGHFAIDSQAVGPWRLLVQHPDHPDAEAEGNTALPGERVVGLRIVLEDGLEIEGRVVGVPPEELASAIVRARSDGSPLRGPRGFAGLAGPGLGVTRSAPVDADGRFTLRGLSAGLYELTAARAARGPGGARSFGPPVAARAGERGVQVSWSPGATLVFRVVDDLSGEPLTRLRVEAGAGFTRPLVDEDGVPRSDYPDGLVRFEGLRAERGERHTLRVSALGYRTHESEIALGSGDVLDLGTLRLARTPLVRVTVVDDASGEPIAGARVELGPAEEPTGGRRFAMRIEDGDEVGDPARFGLTDGSGRCDLNSLPGAVLVVSVLADEHAPWWRSIDAPLGRDVDVEARLGRGGAVAVLVTDAAGEPSPGVAVEHRAAERPPTPSAPFEPSRRSDAAGRVRFDFLAPGRHGFRLDDAPRGGGFSFTPVDPGPLGPEWREVEVAEGETVELVFQAAPRASLSGSVLEDGSPLADARLALQDAAAYEDPFARAMRGGPSATTDGAGRYAFADLRAGEYVLTLSHADRASPVEIRLELDAGENDRDFDLSVTVVEGRVRDPEGRPVAGASVRVRPAGDAARPRMVIAMHSSTDDGEQTVISSGFDEGSSATTDADGRYVLRGVVSDASFVVEASGAAWQPARSETLELDPDERRTGVDFVLQPAGSLALRVRHGDGSPGARMLVTARHVGGLDPAPDPKAQLTDAEGSLELDGLAAGDWEVEVRAMGPGADEAEKRSVVIRPGERTELDVEVP